MPFAVGAALVAWMIAYGRRAKRIGEQLAAAEKASAANAPATRADAEPAATSAR